MWFRTFYNELSRLSDFMDACAKEDSCIDAFLNVSPIAEGKPCGTFCFNADVFGLCDVSWTNRINVVAK